MLPYTAKQYPMMHLFPFSYSSSPPVCTHVPSLVQDGNLKSSPVFLGSLISQIPMGNCWIYCSGLARHPSLLFFSLLLSPSACSWRNVRSLLVTLNKQRVWSTPTLYFKCHEIGVNCCCKLVYCCNLVL